MTLEKYINKINSILEAKYGVGVADLPDYDFASAHEDGANPYGVARQMLAEMAENTRV